MKSMIRLRMGAHDAHYGGNLVDGAKMLQLFGEIVEVGNSSRKMVFEARKVIVPRTDINDSAADVLEEPIVVCRAKGVCVVPKDKQRGNK